MSGRDDARIAGIETDSEPIDTPPVLCQAAVSEVEA
jgi:hypothetical protein